MRIGVLTAFSELVHYYSLTRIVLDQLTMIRRAGHIPVLITLDNFKSADLPEYVELRAVIPTYHKKDYASRGDLTPEHSNLIPRIAEALASATSDLDACLTHDVIFVGWNLPINLALQKISCDSRIQWLHWIHSIPGGGRRDFWTLPPNSKLVYPNYSDKRRCAENFDVMESDVIVIPHQFDARDFLMTTDSGRYLARELGLMTADIVQTFPIPTDRMEAKGLDSVLEVFGKLKKLGRTVRLVVCNSWCNNKAHYDKVDDYRIKCRLAGLGDDDVAFTSRELKHFELGLPNEVIRDLMLLSNLFVCPTKSETFGLTIAEAALAGQLLVLNGNLPAIAELAGPGNALYFPFGSYQQRTECGDWDQFYSDVARIICHTLDNNHALRAKRHYVTTYRSERIWSMIEAAIAGSRHATA